MTFTLWRHDRSGVDEPGKPAPVPCELMTGHPPIAAAAVIALADRVFDETTGDDVIEPPRLPMWWHRDLNAWAAVTDLHRVGMHEQAVQLARLLYWCDRGDATASMFVFEIRRTSSPADGAV